MFACPAADTSTPESGIYVRSTVNGVILEQVAISTVIIDVHSM